MALFVWFVIGIISCWLIARIIRGRGFGLLSDLFLGIVGGVIIGCLAGLFLKLPGAVNDSAIGNILIAFLGGAGLSIVVQIFLSRQRMPQR